MKVALAVVLVAPLLVTAPALAQTTCHTNSLGATVCMDGGSIIQGNRDAFGTTHFTSTNGGTATVTRDAFGNTTINGDLSNQQPLPSMAPGTIDLGSIIGVGVKAAQARQAKAHIDSVIPLIQVHDCAGAVALAIKEKDEPLAQRIPSVCRTREQAGEEPAFAAQTAGADDVITWARLNLRLPADATALSADRNLVQYRLATAAPAEAFWLRTEALASTGAQALRGRSGLMMLQFDCAHGSFRIMASTTYAGQNLSGAGVSVDKPGDTILMRPGSLAELWAKSACAASPVVAQAGR